VKIHKFFIFGAIWFLTCVGLTPIYAQEVRIAYINSNKVLEVYKEAVDVRKQLGELNSQWEREAKNMEKEIQDLQEQLESQSLLLSEQRKKDKQQEIQTLYVRYQQYLQTKWNPQNGEAVKKEVELLKPVFDKINAAIKIIGEAESFNYIFDTVNSNILYASEDQTDLTDKLVAELNKGLTAKATSEGQ